MLLSSPKHLPSSKRSVPNVASGAPPVVPHAVMNDARTAVRATRLAAAHPCLPLASMARIPHAELGNVSDGALEGDKNDVLRSIYFSGNAREASEPRNLHCDAVTNSCAISRGRSRKIDFCLVLIALPDLGCGDG